MNQTAPQLRTSVQLFSQQLSSTRRGARLARLLAVAELLSWGAPPDLTERAELVVAELAANAVLHGHTPGRDFRIALAYDPPTDRLRIEVTDSRGDRLPKIPPAAPAPDTGGRGLRLVAALADHWDSVPYPPSGKTVRALLSEPVGP
ncbi:ATP-binding protein [Streptomyces finlayi]|uniref:ATP-binding protein n=1 Tax=Streptomyces finlayi TaxID=67296 RepID=A0A7G7BEM0_9ACTN|nr:ATP-binding protein [Streptomyces finlayi]QNE73785.1 ATP-binding protein [Streptomyces finlayi]